MRIGKENLAKFQQTKRSLIYDWWRKKMIPNLERLLQKHSRKWETTEIEMTITSSMCHYTFFLANIKKVNITSTFKCN